MIQELYNSSSTSSASSSSEASIIESSRVNAISETRRAASRIPATSSLVYLRVRLGAGVGSSSSSSSSSSPSSSSSASSSSSSDSAVGGARSLATATRDLRALGNCYSHVGKTIQKEDLRRPSRHHSAGSDGNRWCLGTASSYRGCFGLSI